MSMFSRRLQVLLDEERYARLAEEADRRRVSVALVVRDAIDRALPSRASERAAAGQSILDATPMTVPDPDELRRELDEARDRFR